MVLTAYAALSPETNSSCLRHRRISGCARPGWARKTSADLAPATGARTTRFCRPRTVFAKRLRGKCTSAKLKRSRQQCRSSARLSIAHGETALQSLARPTLPRPPHPIPTSVTIAIRPSLRDETAGVMALIWGKREGEYFSGEGWTGRNRLIWFEKFVVLRMRSRAICIHPVRIDFRPSFSSTIKSKNAAIRGTRLMSGCVNSRQLRVSSGIGPSTRTRSGSASPSAIGSGPIPTPALTAETRPRTLLLRAAIVASGATSFSHLAAR